MKRSGKLALGIAAGAVTAAALFTAAPALAAGPSGPGDPGGPGSLGGSAQMFGQGMRGRGAGAGDCPMFGQTAPSGTLTTAQKSTLAATAERAKLAKDLYTAFAARYDDAIFDRAETGATRHLTAVRAMLTRYGVADPTAGKASGAFGSAQVKSTYDRLLAKGTAGASEAAKAAVEMEKAGATALSAALDDLTAADVRQLYTRLLHSAQMHSGVFATY